MDEITLEEPLVDKDVPLPEPFFGEEFAPLAKKPRRIQPRPVSVTPVSLKLQLQYVAVSFPTFYSILWEVHHREVLQIFSLCSQF